ncbi:MAG TPA: penicillin acylase family protein [Acetobacteraceae bacterium]|nr:penicillin acylase family protein [Acetobacteraceae bacterium]
MLAALRGAAEVAEICARFDLSAAEFAAERDAFLSRRAALCDRSVTGNTAGVVEIKRGEAGVPHVYATSTDDLFFGLGFAMAEDRLWQMDRLRRRALGRQAEILGPTFVPSDSAHLTVGIDRIAEADAAAMDDATRAIVTAFSAGINRCIETTRLPIEFEILQYIPEPFTLRDIVAIGRGIWWSLNGRIDRIAAAECARFLPAEALRTLYLTPEASENVVLPWLGASAVDRPTGTDDATGSNNWALAPRRTGTGFPMLCGDPHQPFWVPSSWYEFALHGPEDAAAGAGHPGLPGMWWGSNGTIAWGITNNAASTRDLYREEVHPDDPRRYRDGATWREFEEREVTIPVRGEASRALTIRSTVRGPVVNALVPAVGEEPEPPLSLRWVGAEHLDDLKAAIAISRAREWPTFRAALKDWAVAVFNFVYADRGGNIGYQMAGRLPVRGRIAYGYRDANEAADQWLGYVPFEALPHAFNPARGYVASANQRILPADCDLPIYGAYSQGHRGVRIDAHFARHPVMDREANIRFQNDVFSSRAERMCPHILRRLASSTDADVALIHEALAGWDYRYDLAGPAPTIFETFLAMWQRRVLAEHLPTRLLDLASQQTGLAMSLLEADGVAYFASGTSEVTIAVAKQAAARLRAWLGDDPAGWRWQCVHTAHWRHPLSNAASSSAFDIGPAAVDGGSHTVRNTGGELPPHGANSGTEYRIVVDFAAPDSFLAVQNIGNSGVPGSSHYRDQFGPWLRGEYHTVPLRPGAANATRKAGTRIAPSVR